MKKGHGILALLWITCACMLFQTAMPHHHHGDVSCFDLSHCAPEEEHAGHDHPNPYNESDCPANVFAEVTLVRQQSIGEICPPDFTPLYFTLSLNGTSPVASCIKEPSFPPYRERLRTCFSTRVCAGRAPPLG